MKRLKACWQVGWRVGVCALLLAFIFHAIFLNEGRMAAPREGLDWNHLGRFQQWRVAWTIGPLELWRTLCLIHPVAMAVSLALMGATLILGVVRWRMVLEVQGLHLPLRRATGISFVAHFFNSFLLGSTGGDLMKAYYAARETHHKKTEAVVTVFVDRLIGLWALLLFAAVMMLPNAPLLLRHDALSAPSLLILLMLAALSVVLSVAFWGGVSRRFPQARHWLRKLPKGELIERSLDSCRQFGKHRRFLLKTVAMSVVINIVWVLQIMVLAAGLGLNISPMALFVIVPVIFCISALPITPSGLGVRENLFVLMLAIPEIGVPKTSALSLSLLAYASSLCWSLVGGVVYLGLKEKEHLEEVTHPDTVAVE
jgi:glycosyltransferase 2 family protein